uniref:Uncharacterized protein n=1 Tax=Lutzomyia longipalpis TaxID=7200 RepID=A0A1B0CWK9_LUTLO
MFFTILKRCNIKLFPNFNKVPTKRFFCTTKSENIFQFLKQEASYPIIATTKHNLSIKKSLPTEIPDHVVISDAKRDEFMAYFPAIVEELEAKSAFLDNFNKGKYIREILDSFNILDDILDRSETRNDLPCWYLQNNLGNLAIVDSLLLHCGTYHILRKYFGHLDCYLQLIEVINEVVHRGLIGQRTDVEASEDT